MKAKLLFLFFLVPVVQQGMAQCNYLVYPSPGTIQITTDQTINPDGNATYWICSGVTVTVQSSAGTQYLLEQNVTLHIMDTDGDQIVAKNGCIINNHSDETVTLNANSSQVTANNLGGGMIVQTNCPIVTYDYSWVGGTPCPSMGMESYELNSFNIYPNPVSQGEMITLDMKEIIPGTVVNFYDLSGRHVSSYVLQSNQLKTEEIRSGIYIVELISENQTTRSKLVVR